MFACLALTVSILLIWNFCLCIYASKFKTQVIEDFASENVVYVELRTTPKVTKGSQLVGLCFFVSMDLVKKTFG